ncbi:MAG: cytochrome d ubiquinol oxidase subunit II [Solirubrobacterales bacterium]|nr:cytochrome d ubiquinol oxidase subunit II [Solirubrobacterales bacterium]
MSKADLVAGVLMFGVTLYAVFAGADFGAGFWSMVAGKGESATRARKLIDWAIGPVWEANHVWLIFVIVIMWAAFPTTFASIWSTLFIPLSLAVFGIIIRGSGFAFHEVVSKERNRHITEALFGIASFLTPFFFGTVVGAIASGRVPIGNAQGDAITSWLNPLSILTGFLFVATSAYLAAAFLISDARRAERPDMEEYFARRALVASAVTGAIAFATFFVLNSQASYVFDRLTSQALPLVVVSAVCGIGALVILVRGGRKYIRPLAVAAVVTVVWGWAVAQFPYLLPESLTISGCGTDASLTMVLIVFVIAALLVIPSIGLLYTLDQRSLLGERLKGPDEPGPT